MMSTHLLPDDPALPGLAAIRAGGLTRAIPALGLEPVDLRLVGYSRGNRATLEARTGGRRVAVKCYAKQPESEASVYRALAVAGLTGDGAGVRVPRLLAMQEELRILVIGWLEGPTARDLILQSQGERAGELAARWLRCAASLDVRLGHVAGAGEILSRLHEWIAALGAADASLGTEAAALADCMSDTVPPESDDHLVHGRLYSRHVLEVGDACGVIDWDRFGQGPLEVDAGMFLATLWRSRQHADMASEASRAEQSFRGATTGFLDEARLAWYRAGALLSLASHLLTRAGGDCLGRAHAMLREARRGLEAGRALSLGRHEEGVPLAHWGRASVIAVAPVDERWRSFMDEVATLADELFHGDTAALVCQLVRARDVNVEDLARVIDLLQAREKEMEMEGELR